jgi:hypothetical protein
MGDGTAVAQWMAQWAVEGCQLMRKKLGEIIAAEVNDEVLRVHGHIPPKKGEGIV